MIKNGLAEALRRLPTLWAVHEAPVTPVDGMLNSGKALTKRNRVAGQGYGLERIAELG
ncbi:MAG: hypothetical protein ACO3GX_16680 [Gemmataceae bacterium]